MGAWPGCAFRQNTSSHWYMVCDCFNEQKLTPQCASSYLAALPALPSS